ncbi:MAG: DUF4159 domain-containing protein [Cryomorphaceae bacterium]
MKQALVLISLCLIASIGNGQGRYTYGIGLLKYGGGGDWYANIETSLPNLIRFCNDELGTNIDPEQAVVEVGDRSLFNYPFVHLTGHGNVIFTDKEVQNLRKYLTSGGFLHIDDNYGLDPFIRPQMKKVFPSLDFVELPASHPIFHQRFDFPKGLPKIHAHDDSRPQAFGLMYEGQLVCLYTYECDLGDGWEDPRIHNDTRENHLEALQMGANIIQYVFTNDGKPAG